MTVSDAVAALTQRQREIWAAGDYPALARMIEAEGELCAERAGVQRNMTVLDVATGSGNAAIAAAARGAQVVGIDLVPELLDAARGRAREWGLSVEWVPADAQDLPFADASFDRVLSTFGVQFVPRHEAVAAELVRVCRPGGLIVMLNWTAEGLIGRLMELLELYTPRLPAFASSPARWGDKGHVRDLFDGLGVRMAFERRTAQLPFASGAEWVSYYERNFGPLVTAREALEPDGRWAELRGHVADLVDDFVRPGRERRFVQQDYWAVTAWRGV